MTKTSTILTTLLVSLASSTLLAAPPPKDGGEDHYQIRFSLIFNDTQLGAALQTAPDEAAAAGMRLIVRNVNHGFTLPLGQTKESGSDPFYDVAVEITVVVVMASTGELCSTLFCS